MKKTIAIFLLSSIGLYTHVHEDLKKHVHTHEAEAFSTKLHKKRRGTYKHK